MGNQLTGIAPSQILPVEHYLTELQGYDYEASLGSTRFFKVARSNYKEGPAVVKVFVIHDPSLPLKAYKDHLHEIQLRLKDAANCLPFHKAILTDKAAFLCRQYVKDSLYDRISTRPFLNHLEKKWLAFQLLCALRNAHKLGVCHGDIKSENAMVTSWNWLMLTDFASFKPTYLPEDNPADFSYFFDTSRRRTCNIAPERFIKLQTLDGGNSNIDLTTSDVKQGDLHPAMDIFSAGCVIAELFTDGASPFVLQTLLTYKSGSYSPTKVLKKIEDPHIREMVKHMLQKDPQERHSAEEYLIDQKGKAFPNYFYDFLNLYILRFASTPIVSPDDKITRLKKDLKMILEKLNIKEHNAAENTALVIIISVITSNVRNLHYCSSKLVSLELLSTLSEYVTSDIILDRMLPYMLYMVTDQYPRVRAEAVRTIAACLPRVKAVPVADANIFPEYIFAQMGHLVHDPVSEVRVAFAENIALLAKTAMSFLEMIQLKRNDSKDEDVYLHTSQYQASYDAELSALHEMVQQKVVTLLSDSDNIVKQTLLAAGITPLCVFFGRQKANDILLSHMITFLNDKHDWHLREAFFKSIVGVASYVGWQSSAILQPLLQQGVTDSEETVIRQTLETMTALQELGLLNKPVLHEMIAEVAPFLCHPNTWIRQATVAFVSGVARTLNIADVHCNLIVKVKPFLTEDIIRVDDEYVLLCKLKPPISRTIYDYILRSPHIEMLLEALLDRQIIRSITRPSHSPPYTQPDDTLAQMLRKLISQGMTPEEEDKLLALKDFMVKHYHGRQGSVEPAQSESSYQGRLDLSKVPRSQNICRVADLNKLPAHFDPNQVKKTQAKQREAKSGSPATDMNEDWKQMFGTTELTLKPAKSQGLPQAPQGPRSQGLPAHVPPLLEPKVPVESSAITTEKTSYVKTPLDHPEGNSGSDLTPEHGYSEDASLPDAPSPDKTGESGKSTGQQPSSQHPEKLAPSVRYSSCRLELRRLLLAQQELHKRDEATRLQLDNGGCLPWETRQPSSSWRPKGQLVAHLHEHRGAVNRIQVSPDNAYFATCSNDGTVKLFDCNRMEGRSVTNRSRQTYNKQGGQIRCLTFCENSKSIASASDNHSIHVIRIESSGSKLSTLHQKDIDGEKEGGIIDIGYVDTGSQNVISYATSYGFIVGWDLRSPKLAWKYQSKPKDGVITSFTVSSQLPWLLAGTYNGAHTCWDMRFHLPVTRIYHNGNIANSHRVRRVMCHPTEPSEFISAVQANNEVSMWDLANGQRTRVLWAGGNNQTPLNFKSLPTNQQSPHSVYGMYMGRTLGGSMFMLTGGSDKRIRFWDLTEPTNSGIIVPAASDPPKSYVVNYVSKNIDGIGTITETYIKMDRQKVKGPDFAGQLPDAMPVLCNDKGPLRRVPDMPPVGHHDIITDVSFCQTSQCFFITSSREGVVKVWK